MQKTAFCNALEINALQKSLWKDILAAADGGGVRLKIGRIILFYTAKNVTLHDINAHGRKAAGRMGI